MSRYVVITSIYILLFISIFIIPWWLWILFVGVAVFWLNHFPVLVLGVVADMLYAVPEQTVFGTMYPITVTCILLGVLYGMMRPRLRYNPS